MSFSPKIKHLLLKTQCLTIDLIMRYTVYKIFNTHVFHEWMLLGRVNQGLCEENNSGKRPFNCTRGKYWWVTDWCRYTVYWREQAQSAQIQTRTTTTLHQPVGELPLGLWYDFWVRAETRVGAGPATPLTTIRVQQTGDIFNYKKELWNKTIGSSPEFICAPVYSCSHWLISLNSPTSPTFGLIYEGAIRQPG
jgi:hypothetical protein